MNKCEVKGLCKKNGAPTGQRLTVLTNFMEDELKVSLVVIRQRPLGGHDLYKRGREVLKGASDAAGKALEAIERSAGPSTYD